jgi:hypothetical protein
MILPDLNLLLYAYNPHMPQRFPGLHWENPLKQAR